MFRVLSKEEARKATRWQAPDLTGQALNIAKTEERVSPVKLQNPNAIDQTVSKALSGATPGTHTSAPLLQAAHPLNAVTSGQDENPALAQSVHTSTPATTNLSHQNPSADLLQTSYEEGYSRGYADGTAALHQQSVKQLNTIIASLGATAARADEQILEQELVSLSLEIARLLLRREIQVQPDAMAQLVHAGIRQLPGLSSGKVSVRLHPLDANLVREVMQEDSQVLIMDEPALNRGDCTIESGSSLVHGGLEDWLGAMAAELGIANNQENKAD